MYLSLMCSHLYKTCIHARRLFEGLKCLLQPFFRASDWVSCRSVRERTSKASNSSSFEDTLTAPLASCRKSSQAVPNPPGVLWVRAIQGCKTRQRRLRKESRPDKELLWCADIVLYLLFLHTSNATTSLNQTVYFFLSCNLKLTMFLILVNHFLTEECIQINVLKNL